MAKDESGEAPVRTWAAEIVRRVGGAAKAARANGSARWLSERTEELGYRISPTVIAKLDSGHRGEVLSVAELLIIAAALEVPPVTLLYPNLPDGEVERTPGKVETALSAVRWFAGEDDTGSPEYLPRLLHLSREREGMIRSAKRQEQTLARMAARGEPIDGKSWPRIDYVSHIRQIERMMREIPGATFDEFEFNFPLSYPRGHA